MPSDISGAVAKRGRVRNKLIFVGFVLPDQSGHFFNELLGYKRAAQDMQFEPRVFVPRDVSPALAIALDAERALDQAPDLSTTAQTSLENQVDEFARPGLDYLVDLLSAEGVERIHAIIFPQGNPAVIRTIGMWLARLPAELRPAVFFRFVGKFADAARSTETRAASFYRLAGCELATREGNERIFFVTNSEPMRRVLTRTSCRRSFLVPTPKLLDFPPPAPRRSAETTVYLHLNLRSAELIGQVADIVDKVLRRHRRSRFIVKFTVNCRVGQEQARALERTTPNIEILPAEQEAADYFQNFAECDLVALAYRPEAYTMQASGVFVEAVTLGKPIVVPGGTWMAQEIEAGRGAGTIYAEPTPTSIAEAISLALDNLPALTSQAKPLASRRREESSARNVLERMFALADENPDMAPRYLLGEEIDFSNAYDSRCFMRGGWSSTEARAAWTLGPKAILEIVTDDNPGEPLTLSALVIPFLHPEHPKLTVAVSVNGQAVTQWAFDLNEPGAAGEMWCSASIPAEARGKDGRLIISFAVDSPASPLKLGLPGEDDRQLGLGFFKLLITASRADSAEP